MTRVPHDVRGIRSPDIQTVSFETSAGLFVGFWSKSSNLTRMGISEPDPRPDTTRLGPPQPLFRENLGQVLSYPSPSTFCSCAACFTVFIVIHTHTMQWIDLNSAVL